MRFSMGRKQWVCRNVNNLREYRESGKDKMRCNHCGWTRIGVDVGRCRAHWTCDEARGKSGGVGKSVCDPSKCPPKLREFCTKEFGQLASTKETKEKHQSEMEEHKKTERKQKAGAHQQDQKQRRLLVQQTDAIEVDNAVFDFFAG